MMTLAKTRDLALKALDTQTRGVGPDEPFVGAILRARQLAGLPANASKLLEHWAGQSIGSEASPLRFPWLMTHERFVSVPSYAGDPGTWKTWRTAEVGTDADRPFKLEARLSVPVVLASDCELLLEQAENPTFIKTADRLLKTVLPRVRRDFASFVRATTPWPDTFALWCLVQQPRLFRRLRPLALAIALTYAENALEHGGIVKGTRFPYRGKDLRSSSAYLADALFSLGLELPLVGSLVSELQNTQRKDGGWGDGDDDSEVLTTLAVAQLLAGIVPTFEVAPVVNFFIERQEPQGWWSVLGPERPWLTQLVLRFLMDSERSFHERFRWPPCEPSEVDPKTGLPRFSYFVALDDLFSQLPGLAESEIDVGFLDLAKFKKFNDTFGQERGDDVLRILAEHLSSCREIRTVRDGGDEYLLLGAPTARGLEDRLHELRKSWPAVFRQHFGSETPVVAARILTTRVKAGHLLQAREALGKGLVVFKDVVPGPTGVLRVLEAKL
jgi:GGDEF domain-containing protein